MAALTASIALGEFGFADLVAFCQHDLVADGGFAERVENGVVGVFEPVARVDQHIDASQRGAAAQIIVDEPGPGGDLALGRGGIAVTRHIDQHEPTGPPKEDQFLGPARRVRGARQRACGRSAH